MARTLTQVNPLKGAEPEGQMRRVVKDVVISSYTSGGEALTAADLGLSKIYFLQVQRDDTGRSGSYDYTNSKLKAWVSAGTEVTATTALTLRVMAWGY